MPGTIDLLEVDPQTASQFRELGKTTVASQQLAAKFVLESFYPLSQGRLRHMAALCRACKIEGIRQSKKVANLIEVHRLLFPAPKRNQSKPEPVHCHSWSTAQQLYIESEPLLPSIEKKAERILRRSAMETYLKRSPVSV